MTPVLVQWLRQDLSPYYALSRYRTFRSSSSLPKSGLLLFYNAVFSGYEDEIYRHHGTSSLITYDGSASRRRGAVEGTVHHSSSSRNGKMPLIKSEVPVE